MAVKIVFVCDRCSHETTSPVTDQWYVAVIEVNDKLEINPFTEDDLRHCLSGSVLCSQECVCKYVSEHLPDLHIKQPASEFMSR